MSLFGAAELFCSWRKRTRHSQIAITLEVLHWSKAVEYILWFMAYVWLVPLVGYLPVTLMFCFALTCRLGYRDKRMIVAALLIAIAIVVIFKSFLAVKIPGGALYEYLPVAIRNFMILYL